MRSLQSRNELEVMLLMDLAEICKKVAKHSAVTEKVRVRAGELVQEFNLVLPFLSEGTNPQEFRREDLLIKMARFLPDIVDPFADIVDT